MMLLMVAGAAVTLASFMLATAIAIRAPNTIFRSSFLGFILKMPPRCCGKTAAAIIGEACEPDATGGLRRGKNFGEGRHAARPGRNSVLYKLMQEGIRRVGDIDLTTRTDSEVVRLPEFAKSFSGFAGCRNRSAVRVQFEKLSRPAGYQVHRSRAIEIQPARQSEILPLFDVLAANVEDLNPPVQAIGDVHQTLLIDDDRMRVDELAWPSALVTPGRNEFSRLVEPDHTRMRIGLVMALDDKDVAPWTDGHVGRFVE